MRSGLKVVLIAAIGENDVIGRDGQLPWRLKSDLQHFKRLTIHKPVVMGRKTFESIGKPLKDRTNIVLTRDFSLKAPGAVLATSMDAAFGYARESAQTWKTDEVMVIGGSGVFADTMAFADRLEITRVHASPEGDVFFPPIDPRMWQENSRHFYERGPDDDTDFTTLTYVRAR